MAARSCRLSDEARALANALGAGMPDDALLRRQHHFSMGIDARIPKRRVPAALAEIESAGLIETMPDGMGTAIVFRMPHGVEA
jgi:hypothetical protein